MKRISISKNPSGIIHPKKISAVFKFNPTGKLTEIFFNCQNDEDQFVLQRGIERLVKPSYLCWVKRLFR